MTDKELQRFITDITRGEKIIETGRDLLESIKKNSIVQYVTDGADKKFSGAFWHPEYRDVPEKVYQKYWEAQDKEKSQLDDFRNQIAQFKNLNYYSQANLKYMDELLRDILVYCVQKGYQGTAAMYLRDYAKSVGTAFETDYAEKNRIIKTAINGIIAGYAKRTLRTGYWYGDRALQTIYAAQTGEFGPMAKLIPITELIAVFNSTPTTIEDKDWETVSIQDFCDKYAGLPYKPLTEGMYNKEVARIEKQHGKPHELS